MHHSATLCGYLDTSAALTCAQLDALTVNLGVEMKHVQNEQSLIVSAVSAVVRVLHVVGQRALDLEDVQHQPRILQRVRDTPDGVPHL